MLSHSYSTMSDEVEQRMVATLPGLAPLLMRLNGITGFVSILGDDPRVSIFSRRHHVRRVTRIAFRLCKSFGVELEALVHLVALCHDLNRLPFAHNLEKRIGFDQRHNLEDFLERRGVSLPKQTIIDISEMLSRRPGASMASRMAFAADVVTGFIEDPLLAVTTLGVPVASLPKAILEELGLDFEGQLLRERSTELNRMFHYQPTSFIYLFNETVEMLVFNFLVRRGWDKALFMQTPDFDVFRQHIKKDLLQKYIYPVNNEHVSRGTKLAIEVGIPLAEALRSDGFDPVETLLSMTDQEVLNQAWARGLLLEPRAYYPNLPKSGVIR